MYQAAEVRPDLISLTGLFATKWWRPLREAAPAPGALGAWAWAVVELPSHPAAGHNQKEDYHVTHHDGCAGA